MEKLFGLIGYPLSHSWSANYFSEKFSRENITHCRYQTFPLQDLGELNGLIESRPQLIGLNVTIPYKQQVIPLLDELSASAKEIGAVNTIKITRQQGKIFKKGYNTDVVGFEKSLQHFKVELPSTVLILGTGGAARAVEWVCRKYNCEIFFASRNIDENNQHQLSYQELGAQSLQQFPLIINTSPVGMHPHTDQFPDLPYETLGANQTLYDLVYNPLETLFLQKGKSKGCKTINGLFMLEQQAEAAWQVWTAESEP